MPQAGEQLHMVLSPAPEGDLANLKQPWEYFHRNRQAINQALVDCLYCLGGRKVTTVLTVQVKYMGIMIVVCYI